MKRTKYFKIRFIRIQSPKIGDNGNSMVLNRLVTLRTPLKHVFLMFFAKQDIFRTGPVGQTTEFQEVRLMQ